MTFLLYDGVFLYISTLLCNENRWKCEWKYFFYWYFFFSFADMKGFGYNSEHPGLKQVKTTKCVYSTWIARTFLILTSCFLDWNFKSELRRLSWSNEYSTIYGRKMCTWVSGEFISYATALIIAGLYTGAVSARCFFVLAVCTWRNRKSRSSIWFWCSQVKK